MTDNAFYKQGTEQLLDISLNPKNSVANFSDHRVIWLAVGTSVLAHFFALVWWPVNRPVVERIFSAVTEFNIEVVNLAPIPEPDNFLRPIIPEVPLEELPNVEPQSASAESFSETAESLQDNIVSSKPLRIDAQSIQEAVSSVELSSNPDESRSIPANEHLLSGRNTPGSDQFYMNSQGQNVVIVDGQCFIVDAQADEITHGKSIAIQMGGGGCPYVPSRSEKMLESVMDRVCSRFGCD